jgi:hypothetical protein
MIDAIKYLLTAITKGRSKAAFDAMVRAKIRSDAAEAAHKAAGDTEARAIALYDNLRTSFEPLMAARARALERVLAGGSNAEAAKAAYDAADLAVRDINQKLTKVDAAKTAAEAERWRTMYASSWALTEAAKARDAYSATQTGQGKS